MNEEYIEKLLKTAGSRPEPDTEMMESIRLATQNAWLETVNQQKRKQQVKWFSLATAATLCICMLGFMATQVSLVAPESGLTLAHVSYSKGEFEINHQAHTLDSPIRIGDSVSTGNDSLLSLVLEDRTRITLAPSTVMEFTASSEMTLSSGRIYVDSPDATTSILIHTDWGTVEDIGTLYEVSVDTALSVAVREGKVKIDLGEQQLLAEFSGDLGDVVVVDRNQKITRTQVASTDDQWVWAQQATPYLNLDGITVDELLIWSSRVTGKKVIYDTAMVERAAKSTHLHGGQLNPNQIDTHLPSILKTTRLSTLIDTNYIQVTLSSAN